MLNVLIVDDEKANRNTLKKLLNEYCPSVNIIGETSSVEESLEFLKTHKPDVVFLDVEMPNGTGFDFIRRAGKIDFKIIFVTAHSHYAIKAIKFSAFDYLLKPVDTDELIAAVKNASAVEGSNPEQFNSLLENLNNGGSQKLAVPVKDGFVFLAPEDIIRLQADGTYTHIFISNEKYTGTKNIKEYEQILNDLNFFRSHNSHLINLKHVKRFSRLDGYFVHMSDGSVAEISRRKKEEFLELMTKH
jgi:two-component system LytT family response regulator